MSPKKGYIYTLNDPRDDRVRYVGATADVETRFTQHKSEAVNDEVEEWYEELRDAGEFPPVMQIVDHAYESELGELELEYIEEYDDGDLLNKDFTSSYRGSGSYSSKENADSLSVLQRKTGDIQREIEELRECIERFERGQDAQRWRIKNALEDIRELHFRALELLDGVDHVKENAADISDILREERLEWMGSVKEEYDPHDVRGDS